MSADASSGEEIELLGESDWDEQDLLTIDEARERLEAEINELRASLQQQKPDGAERDHLAHRLQLMERVLQSLEQGPSPLASTTPNY
jgi:predicted  nucleic acid-binding Zn-ribbon protein